ncbi:hypothetical protein ACSFBI_01495 [Variovorax sp. RB3P1]|uniref:hypothetical protein n=1 Tax=Variovorax sp. RB3P1 TaxID=3443732 RepID=UPI003F451C34
MSKRKHPVQVPVTERAVLQRLNRHLARENDPLFVRTTREGSRASSSLGRYYAVNLRTNVVDAYGIALEVWARDVGALKPHEVLV